MPQCIKAGQEQPRLVSEHSSYVGCGRSRVWRSAPCLGISWAAAPGAAGGGGRLCLRPPPCADFTCLVGDPLFELFELNDLFRLCLQLVRSFA